jgi:hypothetical protein
MLVRGKVHLTAPKPNSLHLEKQALLRTRLKTKLNLTSRSNDPLPRKRGGGSGSKKPRHRAMIQRISRRRGHLAVSGDFTFGNRTDYSAERGIPKLVWPCSILCDFANQAPRNGCWRFPAIHHESLRQLSLVCRFVFLQRLITGTSAGITRRTPYNSELTSAHPKAIDSSAADSKWQKSTIGSSRLPYTRPPTRNPNCLPNIPNF